MNKKNTEYLINRKDNQYEVVIGLEVHAQVLSESKLFSSSSTKFGAEPNTQVSLVDAAFPGMLPVINEFCIKQTHFYGHGLGTSHRLFENHLLSIHRRDRLNRDLQGIGHIGDHNFSAS